MVKTMWEIIWFWSNIKDLSISFLSPKPMHCDNQVVVFIIGNSTFYERTKHIKINCHYIQDKVTSRVISTLHVTSSYQLANIFMKSSRDLLWCHTYQAGHVWLICPSLRVSVWYQYLAPGPFRVPHLHFLYKDLCTIFFIYNYKVFLSQRQHYS